MFLIITKLNAMYGILDTEDGVTEYYTKSQVLNFIKSGVKIDGVSATGEIYCKSDSVIKDFLSETIYLLTKFKLLNMTDREKQLEKIYGVAFKYGLCEDKKDMSIDIDKNAVIFHKLGVVVPYDNNCNYSLYNKLDICDSTVTSLSKLGISAFDYITMNIGGKTYTLKQLLSCLNTICNEFKWGYVSYIGITPSNKMFKIVTTYYVGSPICFSVKFDTFSNFKKQVDKILESKINTVCGFMDYIRRLMRNNPADNELVVTKISEKSLRGSERSIYNHLKEKYSTLEDVYIGF